MSNIDKQALREMAERAASDSWGYDRDEFNDAITPSTVLALLDELETAEKRIAELEARQFVVKIPAYVDGRTLGYGEVNHMIDLCVDAFERACHSAGINLTVEG